MGELQAVISDIHGNLEALEAVLADIQRQGATSIVCLGDLVGYGPDPIACVRHALAWDVVLMGDKDFAAMSKSDLPGYVTAPVAKRTIFRVRREMEEQDTDATLRTFLRTRPKSLASRHALYVHGTPRDPTYDALIPEDVYNRWKMKAIAKRFKGLCFCGHTHIPGVFLPDEDEIWSYYEPDESDPEFSVGFPKIICNVGSVGQPRDGDWRASYLLFDGNTVRFRRVEYDVETTIRKIYDDDDYDNMLGDRLRDGR